MTWKSQLNFRDHVRRKLPNISYFTVFWSWLALKHFKTVGNDEDFWNGVFCMLSPGSFAKWYITPASPNCTLGKKKCNFPTFSRSEFSLLYMYSNLWVLQEIRQRFWNGFFCTLLPRASAKWNTLRSSSIYTVPQKKCNFPGCISFETEFRHMSLFSRKYSILSNLARGSGMLISQSV